MEKIRVGVLGLGSIFHRVMTGFYKAESCELYAVAARDLERARSEAEKYGAKKAFGSYDELIACPEVDLIYVATPHGLHYEHVLKCLNAGKNVICEKSFALNAAQAREMVQCARRNNVFLMEAMWTRFLPAMRALKEMLSEGKYGKTKHIYANFAFPSRFDPTSRMFDPKLGGGALLDLGIYPLSIFDYLMGGDPVKVEASCHKAPTGVDARTSAQLTYPGGETAQLMCAIDAMGDSEMVIYTDRCKIKVPNFWCATKLETPDGIIKFPAENEGHHYQFEHSATLIREGKKESPVMSLDETVRIMEIMDSIRLSNGIKYPVD